MRPDELQALSQDSSKKIFLAGVLARIGEKDKAFEALNKAAANGGYNARRAYETDPNLQSLKSDARWKKLLEKLN